MSAQAGILGVQLLRWLFPTEQMPALLRGREAAEWIDRAHRINIGLVVVVVPTMLGCGAGMTWLIARAADWLHGLRGLALFEVTALWIMYAIPGLFLGILVAGAIVYLPLRLWLGADGYRKYEWAASCIAEYDSRRAGKWVVGFVLPPVLLLMTLSFDWHFRVTPTQVQRNNFLSLGTSTRPLAEVERIWLAFESRQRKGRQEEVSYLVFEFRDGERWDTQPWTEWPHADAEAWARTLRKSAGLVVEPVEADRLPPEAR